MSSLLFAHSVVRHCHLARRWAQQILLKMVCGYEKWANQRRTKAPQYHVEYQWMWLSTTDLPLQVDSGKLAPVSLLPILKVLNSMAAHLKLPHSLRIKIKPAVQSQLMPGSRPPLPARFINGAPAYTVRRLFSSRCWGWGLQYFVDWEGYGPEQWSWVQTLDIWIHS